MTTSSVWFYVVYLGQVLLLSFYLPNRILHRARQLIETLPPSEYPKLYPEPLDKILSRLRVYRYANAGMLLVGLVLLLAAWLSDYRIAARYGAYPTAVAYAVYTGLQLLPTMLLIQWGISRYKSVEAPPSGRIRKAELKARRLFEFVSPALIVTAAAMFIGATAVLLYADAGPGWLVGGFPGWLSVHRHDVKIMTMVFFNSYCVATIMWSLYGKKRHPQQTSEERARQIRVVSHIVLTLSILMSAFTAGTHLLGAFELWHYGPLLSSLIVQITGVLVLAAGFLRGRLDPGGFEIYRNEMERGAV